MAYAYLRYQHQVHSLLVKTIKESGVSQKELAEITGIDEATISRLVRRPRNMEINTFSKLIYGAVGATLTVALAYPQIGRSVMLLSAAKAAVENSAARRFIFDDRSHDTPFGATSASSDKGLFDQLSVVSSGTGRAREVANA